MATEKVSKAKKKAETLVKDQGQRIGDKTQARLRNIFSEGQSFIAVDNAGANKYTALHAGGPSANKVVVSKQF